MALQRITVKLINNNEKLLPTQKKILIDIIKAIGYIDIKYKTLEVLN